MYVLVQLVIGTCLRFYEAFAFEAKDLYQFLMIKLEMAQVCLSAKLHRVVKTTSLKVCPGLRASLLTICASRAMTVSPKLCVCNSYT